MIRFAGYSFSIIVPLGKCAIQAIGEYVTRKARLKTHLYTARAGPTLSLTFCWNRLTTADAISTTNFFSLFFERLYCCLNFHLNY